MIINDNSQKNNILIVKAVMISPRYHMQRTKELSKYFNITWLLHHDKFGEDMNIYSTDTHNVITIGERPIRTSKLKSLRILLGFYFKTIKHIYKNEYDLIIVYINILCILLPIIAPHKNYALSMGTSAVSKSGIRNFFIDAEKLFISFFFHKIITGTDWMINKFHLQRKNVIVTRWGTPRLSSDYKKFDFIRLLYLGTLTNRNIHETIEGLAIFMKKHNITEGITYDIIGTGKEEFVKLVKTIIDKFKLGGIVKLHGYLPDIELGPFFDKCNVGVAYIPITEYYTNVVATKLNEYIASGMISIATKTNENKKVVTLNNGILIDDNPESFALGLDKIYLNFKNYSSKLIFDDFKINSLEYVVKNEIVPKYLSLL